MSKRIIDGKKKLDEIYKRLDGKAKILYMAYRNGKLDLENLNDDMKERILKLEEEEGKSKGSRYLKSKLKAEKIRNIKNAIDNIGESFIDDDNTEEKDEEPELSERIITSFDSYKTI